MPDARWLIIVLAGARMFTVCGIACVICALCMLYAFTISIVIASSFAPISRPTGCSEINDFYFFGVLRFYSGNDNVINLYFGAFCSVF